MSTLTFAQLRRANLARQGPDGWNQPLHGWSIDDWAVALGGELGETLNVVKKLNRARDGMPGNQRSAAELLGDLADELADTVLYLDLFMARVEATFEQQIGDRSFVELRNFTAAYPNERAPSAIGRAAIQTLALTVAVHRGGQLLQRLDELAFVHGIDLGAAVVSKFNRTSEKLGFPHRLEAA